MTETPGGYRAGAGRKSQWNRPTKIIRVPVEFEAELLAIMHRLDQGLDQGLDVRHTESEPKFSPDEIDAAIASVVMSAIPPKHKGAIALFKKFRLRLETGVRIQNPKSKIQN